MSRPPARHPAYAASLPYLPVDPAELGHVEDGGRLDDAVEGEAVDELLALCVGRLRERGGGGVRKDGGIEERGRTIGPTSLERQPCVEQLCTCATTPTPTPKTHAEDLLLRAVVPPEQRQVVVHGVRQEALLFELSRRAHGWRDGYGRGWFKRYPGPRIAYRCASLSKQHVPFLPFSDLCPFPQYLF